MWGALLLMGIQCGFSELEVFDSLIKRLRWNYSYLDMWWLSAADLEFLGVCLAHHWGPHQINSADRPMTWLNHMDLAHFHCKVGIWRPKIEYQMVPIHPSMIISGHDSNCDAHQINGLDQRILYLSSCASGAPGCRRVVLEKLEKLHLLTYKCTVIKSICEWLLSLSN